MGYGSTYLFVGDLGGVQIGSGTLLSGDKMITVNSGGHSRLGQTRRDELQHRHLGRGILIQAFITHQRRRFHAMRR